MSDSLSNEVSTHKVSRRVLAAGAAWAVPAISLSAAAPAFATSGPPPAWTYLAACKSPGSSCTGYPKGYSFKFEVCNTSALDIWIYPTPTFVVTDETGPQLTLVYNKPVLPLKVPANGCVTVVVSAVGDNSAQQTFAVQMTVPWGHNATPGVDTEDSSQVVNFVVAQTPPDCGCPPLGG